jgi:hypothetical protein
MLARLVGIIVSILLAAGACARSASVASTLAPRLGAAAASSGTELSQDLSPRLPVLGYGQTVGDFRGEGAVRQANDTA